MAAQDWIELAVSMISQYGRVEAVTFTRKNYQDYNPGALERNPDEELEYICYAAPLDFSMYEKNQVTTLKGTKMLWIPGVDINDQPVDPQIGDIVALESNYRVLEVNVYETESMNCAFLLKIGV